LGLKLGNRKILALVAAVLIAAGSLLAWRWGGTDALLGAVLVTFLGSTLALAWLTAQSERRIRLLVTRLERMSQANHGEQDEQLRGLNQRFDDLEARASRPGEQAEKLLMAINARFTRAELTQDRLAQLIRDTAMTDKVLEAVRSETDEVVEAVVHSSERESKHVSTESKRLFRQVEALHALYADVAPKTAFPPSRGIAASPDLLVYLHQTVRRRQPELILECGSGLSTLVMAHALRSNGTGRVVALEHSEKYRDLTMEWARDQEVEQWLDVRLAPLVPVTLEGEEWPWYSTEVLPDGEIDLLFVDGPPGETTLNARFPAFPILVGRLSSEAMVILDDSSRVEEAKIAERWAAMFPDWVMTRLPHEKGTVVFTRAARGDS
jgi:predicted O-methyltransferase YrrM